MNHSIPLQADDENLGMNQPITRRDFLNGVALLTTAAATSQTPLSAAPASSTLYYPPGLTGMRGSHPGSYESAHALRDGKLAAEPVDLDERYDLIVVGAGISGLSAAHFFRERNPRHSRILLLDNHDDFGGHAKRNEFHLNGRLLLMNGGTLEIDSPRPYSEVAANLVKTLGIDVQKLAAQMPKRQYYEGLGLKEASFFDRETFGADYLAVGTGHVPIATLLANAPLSAAARAQIEQIEEGHIDYLPGLDSDQKKDRLSRMSYASFLQDLVKAEPAVIQYYIARTQTEWGVGADAVSALDWWAFGLPGLQGMQLAKGSIARMGYTPSGYHDTGGSYHLHFPDGNATIARSLVRDLIPGALPGRSIANIVTARADYSQLDRPTNAVRLRLNSTALKVQQVGEVVEVTYASAGRTYRVRGRGAVLACYNAIIPYLCPELPEKQKAALHAAVKAPLVYTTVALRNWKAFQQMGFSRFYAPGSYHVSGYLDEYTRIGGYQSVHSPEEPILLHLTRVPCKPGLNLSEHDQNRAGRAELLATSFETFERNIRDQLNRMLGAGGFDAAKDILGITVNRWPHGYAAEYNPLFDPEVPEAERHHVIGRAMFGRITIANSDAGGAAYTDSAINQAHRAVGELLDSWQKTGNFSL